jgi:hypothetical protein
LKRDELAHLLRAAARIAGDHRMLVVGSQAALASMSEEALPTRVTMSMEADIVFMDDPEETKSDAVDGAIGEGSQFHQTFGYYAQGVTKATAVLPDGWEDRALRFVYGDYGDAEALCPEIHDLVVSKLVAGREKDRGYAAALLEGGAVDRQILRERVGRLRVVPGVKRRLLGMIDRLTPSQ